MRRNRSGESLILLIGCAVLCVSQHQTIGAIWANLSYEKTPVPPVVTPGAQPTGAPALPSQHTATISYARGATLADVNDAFNDAISRLSNEEGDHLSDAEGAWMTFMESNRRLCAQLAARQDRPYVNQASTLSASVIRHRLDELRSVPSAGDEDGFGDSADASEAATADNTDPDPTDERLQEVLKSGDGGTDQGMSEANCSAEQEYDSRLNATYNKLMSVLKPQERVALKRSQVDWISFRTQHQQLCDAIADREGTMWRCAVAPAISCSVVGHRALELESLLDCVTNHSTMLKVRDSAISAYRAQHDAAN